MMTRRIGLMIGVLVVFLAGVGMGVLAQGDEPAPEVAQGGEAVNGVGTAFTYQGVLTDNGQPADGAYDLEFRLYDAATGGNQIGSVVTMADQAVSDGLLAVSLDFGENVFGGSPRFLEIGVRPGSSTGSYEALATRQPLTASPYAIHAGSASVLAAEMQPPAVITVTATGDGFLTAGTYYFKIVTSDGVGTSVGSEQVTCTVDGSSTNRCALVWEAVPGAAAYRIYKGATSNGQNLYQTSSTNSYDYDTDSGATTGTVPTTATAFVNYINPSGNSWFLSGNVGVGTTNPEATLHLNGDGVTLYGPNSGWGGYLQVGGSGYSPDRASISTSDGTLYLDDKDGGSGTFINNYSQNNTLLNAQGGNVGIGSTNPTEKLDVAGNVLVQGNLEVVGTSSTGPHFITPVTVSSGTGTVPWTTFDASAYIPVNATAVILEGEGSMSATDENAYIMIRRDSSSPNYLLLRGEPSGPGEDVSWGSQGIFPTLNRTFQFTISGVGFNLDYSIRLVGYFN